MPVWVSVRLEAHASCERSKRTSDGAHAPGEAYYAHGMRLAGCIAALTDHCLDDTAPGTQRSRSAGVLAFKRYIYTAA